MAKRRDVERLTGLRPCGCTRDVLCPQHWQLLTYAEKLAWKREHQRNTEHDKP